MNLNYFTFKQLPIIEPGKYRERDIEFISKRVSSLTFTSMDIAPWAAYLGLDEKPFVFDQEHRSIVQSEIDAYFARIYGLERDELEFVLDPSSVKPGYPSETFSVLKRNELRQFGEYRTRRLVLEAWDRLHSGALH